MTSYARGSGECPSALNASCEELEFHQTSENGFIRSLEADLRRPKTSQILYVIAWYLPEAHFLKVCLGASLGNEMQMLRCFGHAQMCLW